VLLAYDACTLHFGKLRHFNPAGADLV